MKRRSSYAKRKRLLVYMAWVRTQPCRLRGVAGAGPCDGGVEADHAGQKPGMSRKAPDSTCIPMCRRHHLDRTNNDGFFRQMSDDERRLWRAQQIAATQAAYQRHQAGLAWF